MVSTMPPERTRRGKDLTRAERASIRYLTRNGLTIKDLETIFERKRKAIQRAIDNMGTTLASINKDKIDKDPDFVPSSFKTKTGESLGAFRRRLLSEHSKKPATPSSSASEQGRGQELDGSPALRRSARVSPNVRRDSAVSDLDLTENAEDPDDIPSPRLAKRRRVVSDESLSPAPYPSPPASKAARLGPSPAQKSGRMSGDHSLSGNGNHSSGSRPVEGPSVARTNPIALPIRSREEMNLPARSLASVGSHAGVPPVTFRSHAITACGAASFSATRSSDAPDSIPPGLKAESSEFKDFKVNAEDRDSSVEFLYDKSGPEGSDTKGKSVAYKPLLGRANPPTLNEHGAVLPTSAGRVQVSPSNASSSSLSDITPSVASRGSLARASVASQSVAFSSAVTSSVQSSGRKSSAIHSSPTEQNSSIQDWFSSVTPDMPKDDIENAVDILKSLGIKTMQQMKSIAKENHEFQSGFYGDFVANGGTVYAGRMWMLALRKLQTQSDLF